MARIPLGNFGTVIANPAPKVGIPAAAFDTGGAALQKLGETGMQVATDLLNEQQRQKEEEDRSHATVAVITHQSAAQDALDGVKEQIATGEITRDKAPQTFSSAMSEVRTKSMSGVPEWLRAQAGIRFEGVEQRAMIGLNHLLEGQRRQELAGNLEFIRDTMAKDAGRPGADIDTINNEFEQAAKALGPQAGIAADKVGKLVQDFRDGNWFNQAKIRATVSRSNLDDLTAMERDLKSGDGFYMSRLNADKRAVLLATVAAHRLSLESKVQHLSDRREAAAERTIAKIDQQIASGVPATPDMWVQWETDTRGTEQSEAFRDRIKSEEEVQRLLREPLEKQATFIREREAAMLNDGGTLRDKANVDRLKRVLENSRKQLQEAPLLFAQNRTGDVVKPLDLGMLLDPAQGKEVAGLIGERVATVAALRSQYGDTVKARVLLPNEADALTKTLDKLAPDQQVEIFRAMRLAIGDDTAYQGTLVQIAPDSPVRALAGSLAARGADYVQPHVFSPDESITARQTAQLALLGESLLNPTKGQKAQDGKMNTWIMPKKADMLRRFNDKVGDTFAGTPQAMDAQFELVQATYAGLLASRGGTKNPEIVDTAVFEQAIERTTPVMKQGGASFLKPIVGMSDEQFREKLRAALPEELRPQYDRLPLRNVRSNQYVILNGARPLTDKAGTPLIVTVKP
ncbi:hypothetical protein [Sulfuritalea hydrogenivorans]|uniref:Uncharacterized protein n=1 Tax=Sulfuritalea hydrogenivorans sk43H TaxID=1223802 RepID=W0SEM6_9PROT|nr:hypothetical protein [Sulfuritalea hydrogenivorans]BAO29382.1 hypothetical protein SUTH_01589 [Sulfuritalea hydrogenivorans sk43H]